MTKAGDQVYQVSGSGDVSRRFFATRKAAERYLREELGATFDDKAGWHTLDETDNIKAYYDVDEITLG